MSLFKSKKKQLTRRELVLQRREASADQTASDLKEAANYRRSRTLSAKRAPLNEDKSERQQVWKLRQKRQKFSLILFGTIASSLIVIGLLSQLSASTQLQTPDLQSQSNSGRYIELIDKYYTSRPLERLRFMLDESALHAFFLEQAPEVKTIRMARGDQLGTSKMQLSFRQPTVQWASGKSTYYVDDSGITFEKSYFTDPGIVVNDQSGVPYQPGQEVINRQFLSFLGQSVSMLRDNQRPVSEVILPPNTIRQVEFKLVDPAHTIKMTVDRSAESQVQQALHALEYMDENKTIPEYLDVRVNQRVFYK